MQANSHKHKLRTNRHKTRINYYNIIIRDQGQNNHVEDCKHLKKDEVSNNDEDTLTYNAGARCGLGTLTNEAWVAVDNGEASQLPVKSIVTTELKTEPLPFDNNLLIVEPSGGRRHSIQRSALGVKGEVTKMLLSTMCIHKIFLPERRAVLINSEIMRGHDQLVYLREDNPAQQSGVLSTQKTCQTLRADHLIKLTAQEANTTCENVDKVCIETISNFYNHILSGGVVLLDSKSNSREFFFENLKNLDTEDESISRETLPSMQFNYFQEDLIADKVKLNRVAKLIVSELPPSYQNNERT